MTATTPIGDIQLSQPGEGARYVIDAVTSVFPLFDNNNECNDVASSDFDCDGY